MSGFGALVRFFFFTMFINKVYLWLLKMRLSISFFSCCREVEEEPEIWRFFLFCLENKVPAGQEKREAII